MSNRFVAIEAIPLVLWTQQSKVTLDQLVACSLPADIAYDTHRAAEHG